MFLNVFPGFPGSLFAISAVRRRLASVGAINDGAFRRVNVEAAVVGNVDLVADEKSGEKEGTVVRGIVRELFIADCFGRLLMGVGLSVIPELEAFKGLLISDAFFGVLPLGSFALEIVEGLRVPGTAEAKDLAGADFGAAS